MLFYFIILLFIFLFFYFVLFFYSLIILYDIRGKRLKSRSCLHDKTFDLGTRRTWGNSDVVNQQIPNVRELRKLPRCGAIRRYQVKGNRSTTVHACMTRHSIPRLSEHEEVTIYTVNQQIPNTWELKGRLHCGAICGYDVSGKRYFIFNIILCPF